MLPISDAIWTTYRWGLRFLNPSHPVSLAMRAEEALNKEQWDVAFDLSHAALLKQPDFGPAFFVRALGRLHLDDYCGALYDLNRFLALVEEPPPVAYYWRGWIYTHKEEWSLALVDFDRVLASGADDAQLHYWRTYVFWQREQWDKMRDALARLEAVSPNNAPAWELRGHLRLHEGAYSEAEVAYTRAMADGWDNPDLRYNRAVARRYLGRHAEAMSDIEAIFSMDPDNLWAHLELSGLALLNGDYEQALHHARRASVLNPEFFEGRISEAAALMAMGSHDQARGLLELLRQKFPDEIVVDQLLGDLLSEKNENGAAAESYYRALQKDPDHHTIRLKLASEFMALTRYDEALAQVMWVLEEDPDCEDGYATRADLYRLTNQPAAMRADLDRLLELNPYHAWALTFRAAHRQWLCDLNGALKDYNAALMADNSEAWIWAFRGQFHLRTKRYQAARKDFQMSIMLSPEDPWIRRQWADLLLRCGHADRAADVVSCLIEDEPDDGFARLFRAELHLMAEEWQAAQKQFQIIVQSDHELAWLAHAALAVFVQGEQKEHHLRLAKNARPEPTYWGMTPAIVLGQRALVAWQSGQYATAEVLLREATERLEPGEIPWQALHPLFTYLCAYPLLILLDEYQWEQEHAWVRKHIREKIAA
ncbi:MAG: tetratricopeptide repeat protein [Ardenticatenaceae bacterium]